jgi:hypothetical protein
MVIARRLADEGAELRHSEIMELYVRRAEHRPYDAALRNALKLNDLRSALTSIKDIENIRRKYVAENDKEGLRQVREIVVEQRQRLAERSNDSRSDDVDRQVAMEIAEWLSHWLQTPTLFADWVEMRQRSKDFLERFGKIKSG